MDKISALLAPCVGNSPVTGELPAQRPVTRNFDVFFALRLNKWLSKQSWGWWFETPSRSLWRHCNALHVYPADTDGFISNGFVYSWRIIVLPIFMEEWLEYIPLSLALPQNHLIWECFTINALWLCCWVFFLGCDPCHPIMMMRTTFITNSLPWLTIRMSLITSCQKRETEKASLGLRDAVYTILCKIRSHIKDKQLSEPMMVSILTHICVTRPRWVKVSK